MIAFRHGGRQLIRFRQIQAIFVMLIVLGSTEIAVDLTAFKH